MTLLGININYKTIIITGVMILVGYFLWSYHQNQINDMKKSIEDEKKLRNALNAEIKRYQNERDEWVSEKLTLQTTIEDLTNVYSDLNENQQELVNRLNNVKNNQETIAAALFDVEVSIEELTHTGETEVDDDENTVEFTDINENIEYKFLVGKVNRAFSNIEPTLNIRTLRIPNKQEINFKWEDDKKEGYPVSFNVVNSNPFIETTNMESYIIPEIRKDDILPNKWDRFKLWTNEKSGKLIITTGVGLIGVGIGALVF